MATVTRQRRKKAEAEETPKPLEGQLELLGGEQQPTRVVMRRDHFGTNESGDDIWAKGGLDYDAVRRTDDGIIVLVGEDRDELEVPTGSYAVTEWHHDAERKPTRVQLVTAVTLHTKDGPKSIEPPEQFDVVEVLSKGSLVIDAKKLGRWPIGQGDYKVIVWSDTPAPKSLTIAAAARANKESPAKKNGKPHVDFDSPAAPATPIGELPLRQLSVDQLVRHPKNRTPKQSDVAAMAESLKADGQIEPLLVRQAFGTTDWYSIVSGETRWLAAKKAGLKKLACRVIDCDDARTLELLAICNAKRTDLDPIEKARMIVELCKPTAEGGAGMTRDAAAKVYGLESGAAASNLVRLLELPEKPWQQRIISGELPQSYARPLTAIAAAPKLLEVAEKDWQYAHREHAGSWDKENWESRDAVEEFVGQIIDEHTRPIDDKTKYAFSYNEIGKSGVSFPRLFELTDAVRAKLEIHTFTIDKKQVELATNAEAWNKLQIPLAEAKLLTTKKGKAAAAGADDEPAEKPKPLTPAQRRAAEKEKQKKLDEHLVGWRHGLLKRAIAYELMKSPANPKPVERAVVRKLFTALVYYGMGGHVPRMSSDLEDSEPKGIPTRQSGHGIDGAYEFVSRVGDDGLDKWQQEAAAKFIGEEDDDARRPAVPFDLVDAIAAELGIDVAAEWLGLQTSGPRCDRDRLEQFLVMHNSEQLRAQAEAWKIYIPEGRPKKAAVELILGRATPLPLPKSVKPLAKSAAAAAAKKPAAKKGAKPR
jgi:ParB/RepB/Spo0J family partition protein